jgi:hypothetical protein
MQSAARRPDCCRRAQRSTQVGVAAADQIAGDRLVAFRCFEQEVLRIERNEFDDLLAAGPELVRASVVLACTQLATSLRYPAPVSVRT